MSSLWELVVGVGSIERGRLTSSRLTAGVRVDSPAVDISASFRADLRIAGSAGVDDKGRVVSKLLEWVQDSKMALEDIAGIKSLLVTMETTVGLVKEAEALVLCSAAGGPAISVDGRECDVANRDGVVGVVGSGGATAWVRLRKLSPCLSSVVLSAIVTPSTIAFFKADVRIGSP